MCLPLLIEIKSLRNFHSYFHIAAVLNSIIQLFLMLKLFIGKTEFCLQRFIRQIKHVALQ